MNIEQIQDEIIEQNRNGRDEGFDAGYAAGYREAMRSMLGFTSIMFKVFDTYPVPSDQVNHDLWDSMVPLLAESSKNANRSVNCKFKGQTKLKKVFMSD